MLKLAALSVAFAGLLTTAAMAEAHADQIAALIAAIEANGCVITGENAMTIIDASGLDPAVAEGLIGEIGEAGEEDGATVMLTRNDDGSTTMVSPNCPAD
jgi:hypothetical protein